MQMLQYRILQLTECFDECEDDVSHTLWPFKVTTSQPNTYGIIKTSDERIYFIRMVFIPPVEFKDLETL